MDDIRGLQAFAKQVTDQMRRHTTALNQLNARATRQDAELREKSVQPSLKLDFDSAKNYSTVVMTIGYGGFFALWAMVKDDASPRLYAVSGIAIALSLLFFIAWEMVQMLTASLAMRAAAKRGEFTQAWLAEHGARHTNFLLRIWPWFFALSAGTALVGTGCLLAVLVARLMRAF